MKLLNRILSCFNKIIPKSNQMISFYGRTAINDNGLALLDYISKEKDKKYKLYIIVSKDVEIPNRYLGTNVKIINNPIKSLYLLLRSKWIFHTYGMFGCCMLPARGQIIFSLWHGSPLKKICKLDSNSKWNFNPNVDSYYLSASKFWNEINKACWGYRDEQLFIGSNPRNDYMFSKTIPKIKGVKEGNKIILFMPTFRTSSKLNRQDTSNSFPILKESNIHELDSLLHKLNITLIIKPHPAQNDIPIFSETYKNILVLRNKDLNTLNINLYELLGKSDALISDFSSVYFDYLLMDKPIGFAIDDIQQYTQNRGFTVKDPLALMPGPKIQSFEDLKIFISEIQNKIDNYVLQRQEIRQLTNQYCEANACKRITDFVGII